MTFEKLYKDPCTILFGGANSKEEFSKFLAHKEGLMERLMVPASSINICAAHLAVKNGETVIKVSRLTKDYHIENEILFNPSEAMVDTVEETGTHLFLSVPTQYKKKRRFIPISNAVSLSLTNRSRASLHLDLTENHSKNDDGTTTAAVNTLSLASVYEDMIKLNSTKLQIIILDGKAIGIMTNRYVSIPQKTLFDDIVYPALRQDFANTELVNACYTHNSCMARYDIKTEYSVDGSAPVHVLLDVYDSQNGYSEFVAEPVYTFDGKHYFPLKDDGYNSAHRGISKEAIIEDFKDILPKLKPTATAICEMQKYNLKYPISFLKNAIVALNRKATHMKSPQLRESTIVAPAVSTLDNLIAMRLYSTFSPIDVFEIVLEQIESSNNSEETKNGLRKTLSRFVRLDIEKLDVLEEVNP